MSGSSRAGLRATILRSRRIDKFGQKYCLQEGKNVQGDAPQGRHVAGGMAGAQAAAVLLEGVVQHPVQAVLDAPVPAHQVGHAGGPDVHGQVGDAVAHGAGRAVAHGAFGDHAHGAAQPGPELVGIDFVQDAVVAAQDGAGARSVRPCLRSTVSCRSWATAPVRSR